MATNYTTRTAALKATKADINKLDAKKMLLNGKNILDYIKENTTVILDERGTKADDELDIWNSYVTKDVNGNVIINRSAKPHVHSVLYGKLEGITETQVNTLATAVKVIDNEVLGANDKHIMYWQTDGLTDCFDMFYCCTALTAFSSDLSSLSDSSGMFKGCHNLTTFSSDLSSLTDGSGMFQSCTNLTSFNSELPSLTNGNSMFYYCNNLTSFNSELSTMMNGYYMFANCSKLNAFNSNLSNLTIGFGMFQSCTNLTSFNSELPSLTNGNTMFWGCKLDAQSVANIIHFIPQRDAKPTSSTGIEDGNIFIGVGIANTDEAKQAFAEECDCDTWEELNKEFDDKNWAVQWQFNGEASTFDLRAERPSTAVYAKLEEVIMPTEDEIVAAKEKGERITIPTYEYTSQDGDNYYNIHWYHDSNTNNEGYDYFESLEMATLAYSVIPRD